MELSRGDRRLAMLLSLVTIALAISWLPSAAAQQSSIDYQINTSATGLPYLLLLIVFTLNFTTPIIRWVYLNFLHKYVVIAGTQIERIKEKLSDRISSVGRQQNNLMRL